MILRDCAYCEETANIDGDDLDHDEIRAIPRFLPNGAGVVDIFHVECLIRMLAGSVAHQQGRCSCYRDGEADKDPPGMTKRQAARLAAWVFDHEGALH